VESNIFGPSVESNICGPSAWISLHVFLLTPTILKLSHLSFFLINLFTPAVYRPTYSRGYREHREASSHNGWRSSLLTFMSGCPRTTSYILFEDNGNDKY
jgi:hypothetical protein